MEASGEFIGDATLEIRADWRELKKDEDAAARYTAQKMDEMARSTRVFTSAVDNLGSGLRGFVKGHVELATVTVRVRELMMAYKSLEVVAHDYVVAGQAAARVTDDLGTALRLAATQAGLTAVEIEKLGKEAEKADQRFYGLIEDTMAETEAMRELNVVVGEFINLQVKLKSMGPLLSVEERRAVLTEPAYQGLAQAGAFGAGPRGGTELIDVGELRAKGVPVQLPSDVTQLLVTGIGEAKALRQQLLDAIAGEAVPGYPKARGPSAFERATPEERAMVARALSGGQKQLGPGTGMSGEELAALGSGVAREMAPVRQAWDEGLTVMRTQARTTEQIVAEMSKEARGMRNVSITGGSRSSTQAVGPNNPLPVAPESAAAGGLGPRAAREPTAGEVIEQVPAGTKAEVAAGATPQEAKRLEQATAALQAREAAISRMSLFPELDLPMQHGFVSQLMPGMTPEIYQQLTGRTVRTGTGAEIVAYLKDVDAVLTRIEAARVTGTGGIPRLAQPETLYFARQPAPEVVAAVQETRKKLVQEALGEMFGPEFARQTPRPAQREPLSAAMLREFGPAFRPIEPLTPSQQYQARRANISDAERAAYRARLDIARMLTEFGQEPPPPPPPPPEGPPLFGMGGGDFFRRIFWGGGGRIPIPFLGGLAGAGFGSIGALAGLGPEHVLGTIGAVAASAGGAALGAGTIAAGALGQLAVGGGADIAVLKSTITDTRTLSQSYQNLQNVIAQYGKNSTQAALAQSQLNVTAQQLGATFNKQGQIMQPGIAAELQLAKATDSLNKLWDQQTQLARVQATNILEQIVTLGRDYVPRVAKAAQDNLSIINVGLRPLFSWLEGPQGIKIFNDLENHFKQNLPTAVHAFSQAVEVLLRFVDAASGYTGRFITALDHLFTKLNDRSPQYFSDIVHKLVSDFQLWERLIKLLGEDLVLIFRQNAGAGKDIIGTLNGMLQRLHDWLTTSSGQQRLHTVFETHKQEVLALLGTLKTLGTDFAQFYLTVSPLLTGALTGVISLLGQLASLSPALGTFATAMLAMQKFGVLVPVFKALRGAMFGVAEGEVAMELAGGGGGGAGLLAGGAGAAGAAERGLTRGTAAADLGAVGLTAGTAEKEAAGFFSKTGLLRAAGFGGLGYLGSTILTTALGTKGLASAAIQGAGTGAGIGFSVFGPWGAAAGAAIGGGIGAVLNLLFSSGSGVDHGKKFADGLIQPLHHALTTSVGPTIEQAHRDALAHTTNLINSLPTPADLATNRLGRFGTGGAYLPGAPGAVALETRRAGLYALQGRQAARTFIDAFGAVKFPTTLAFTQDAINYLGNLKPIARDSAVSMLLEYAHGLEVKKELPKRALGDIISSLEAMWPGLTEYLRKQGEVNDSAVADSMKMKKAHASLAQTMQDINTAWGIFTVNPTVTGKNWADNVHETLLALRQRMLTTHGQIHQDAVKAYSQLRDQVVGYFGDMSAKTVANIGAMKDGIVSGSTTSQKQASQQFQLLQKNIGAAVAGSALTVNQGTQLIAEALNQILKTFGGGQLSMTQIKALTPGQLQAVASGQVSAGAAASPHAAGGLVQVGQPGQRGADTIPMNVGGMPIMVGAGEQVAVFNAHQQQVMNQRLADYGGLPGFFDTVNMPHAQYQSGGYVFPFPRNQPFTWQRIDQGQDLQESPGGPVLAIGPGNVSMHSDVFGGFGPYYAWEQMSSGPLRGQTIYYGHIKTTRTGPVRAGEVIGITQARPDEWTAAPAGWLELGLTTALGHGVHGQGAAIAPLLHALATGHRVTGFGGAAGAIPTLRPPQVEGRGELRDIVQAAMNLETNAANAYIARYAPLSSGTTAGLSGSLINMVHQIARRMGWGPALIQDWLNVIQAESGGRIDATNPTSGAYGIAQMYAGHGYDIAANKAKYYAYGGDPNTMAGQLLAMANYIKQRYHDPAGAWSSEQTIHSYARGGFVGFQGGGDPMATAARVPSYERNPSRRQHHRGVHTAGRPRGGSGTRGAVPHRPTRAHAIHPPKGFRIFGLLPKDIYGPLDTINADDKTITDLQNLLTLLQGEEGLYPIGAIVTPVDASGNALDPVVNWGDGAGTMLRFPPPGGVGADVYGMEDPSSNTWQYGIDVRLGEIGPLSGLGGTGTDSRTELGIYNQMLNIFNQELAAAHPALTAAWKHYRQLERTVGFYDPKGQFVPGLEQVKLDRMQTAEKWLAPTKQDIELMLQDRYRRLRAYAHDKYAKKRLHSQLLRTQSITNATNIQDRLDANLPPSNQPPAAFVRAAGPVGGAAAKAAWPAERQAEYYAISIMTNNMRAVVNSEAMNAYYKESLNYKEAILALDHQETMERKRLNDVWAGKRIALQQTISQETKDLQNKRTLLDALTGGSYAGGRTPAGIIGQLRDYVDPRGTLRTVNIATLQDVTIPGLYKEIQGLKATVKPQTTSGSADSQNLLNLQQQRLTMQAEMLASQATGFQILTTALENLPPFAGSFQSGGIIPGPLGEARTIIAHGGETVTPTSTSDQPMRMLIRMEDNRTRIFIDDVEQQVIHSTSTASRHARRALPGRAGGLLSSP